MKQKVLVIVGPTASGKSALGVELARRFSGEIISADSRQVYKGLDIGTGKITKREMRGVPHHLLDVVSPKKIFSAEDYIRLSRAAIHNIGSRDRLPIVVGGTGFYVDALLGRAHLANVPPDPSLRTRLAKKTTGLLLSLLMKLDRKRWAVISRSPSERNNKVRLIRAVEIATAGVKREQRKSLPRYDILWVGVMPEDAALKQRINTRLRQRIRKGMVREAVALHKSGVSYKRMRELGLEYRSLARHLQGEISIAEMENELQSSIWRYSRKQIGYWKRNKAIKWFKPDSVKIRSTIRSWLQR